MHHVNMETAGRMLQCSRTTLYRMIQDGQIKSTTFGRRRVIDLNSIREYQTGDDEARKPATPWTKGQSVTQGAQA